MALLTQQLSGTKKFLNNKPTIIFIFKLIAADMNRFTFRSLLVSVVSEYTHVFDVFGVLVIGSFIVVLSGIISFLLPEMFGQFVLQQVVALL